MEWVQIAEAFIGRYGWGSRGKHIGISRMFNDSDKSFVSRNKVFASIRPRGVLSGFLAIVPELNYAVFLPPIAAKSGPLRVRLRISETLQRNGAIFSAYLNRDKVLVLEDVLVWEDKPVWSTDSFEERWNKKMTDFLANHWRPDATIQCDQAFELANYVSLATLAEPDSHSVVEFISNAPNTKRMIWIPNKTTDISELPTISGESMFAKKETISGPDVYSVWRGDTKLGTALVRTLAISRALRLSSTDAIKVNAIWNKQFEKWEILALH